MGIASHQNQNVKESETIPKINETSMIQFRNFRKIIVRRKTMKKQLQNLFFGKKAKLTFLVVFALFAFVGLACKLGRNETKTVTVDTNTSKPAETNNKFGDNSETKTKTTTTTSSSTMTKANAGKWEVPGDEEMKEMTRTALMDFDSAVKQGDFTDFHSKLSKTWQRQTTPEQFNTTFSEFINKKVDISNVEDADPKYSASPSVMTDKGARKLIATGCYDISPRPAGFTLKWIPEGKEWKLFGIEVDTTIGAC